VTGWRAALLLKGHRMLDQAAPDRPHWYLRVVGVAPQYQRHGVGMVLLRPALERCDREGTPAYLVASQCKNVPFYEQQGFRVTAELRLPRGPLMWPMIREPRTAD
jgi:GNAT superfamily N-acetyltransferase